MKIRMLTLSAGPAGVRRPGEVHEVPVAEAEALIAGGYAAKVAPDRTPNLTQGAKTETDEAAETAEDAGNAEIETAERAEQSGAKKAVKTK